MLQETSQEKALRLAAVRPLEECAEIQARIRKAHLRTGYDPDGRPPRLERLVAHIREHLFEGTLSVEGACKEVGIGDGGVGGELRAYIGFTVDELIDKLRIDTAFPLVAETGFSMGDIAHLVGFRTYRTFTRTYSIWVGEPPRKTRKRYRGGTGEPPADLPVDIPFDFRDFRTVRRVGEGAATPNDLERLRRALSELYPDTFGDLGPDLPETVLGPPFDAEVLERFQAERVVWPTLGDLPFAGQRRYIRQCRSWTSALFDFLHQKSRDEGRRDRQRGIELAQLALDSLDGNDGRLGERIHSLRAQGWAWLGNARRLALEFLVADRALNHAEAALQLRGCREDSFAHGIVYLCKGSLRMFQRRYQEAISLFDLALEYFAMVKNARWQIETLLHRSSASFYLGRYEEVEPDVKWARGLLVEGDTDLEFRIEYTMANTFRAAGRVDQAQEYVARLTDLATKVSIPLWRLQVRWLTANIDHDSRRAESAEKKYIAIWQDMRRLREPLYEALVLLDLAILYVETQQYSRAVRIATAVYPVFSSIKLYDAAAASVGLLKEAVEHSSMSSMTLLKLRSSLGSDPLVSIAISPERVRSLDLTPNASS